MKDLGRIGMEIVLFVMPWEIDRYDTTVTLLKQGARFLPPDHRVCLDVSLCLSDHLIDWDASRLDSSFFADRFRSINQRTDWAHRVRARVEQGTGNLGCVDHRRRHLRRCEDGMNVVWLDADIVFHPRTLRIVLESIATVDSEHYILTPQMPKKWDESWDCLTHPRYLDEDYGFCFTFDPYETLDIVADDRLAVELTEISPSKLSGGWMTTFDAGLLKLIDIPDSFEPYGEEDTFVMRAADGLRERGVDVRQYVMDNLVVAPDFRYDRLRPYLDRLVVKIDKEAMRSHNKALFADELERTIKRITGK